MDTLKPITKQFVAYFGAALVGYAVDFSTLVILHDVFHIYYLFAAGCGFTLGLIVLYIITRKHVFGESKIKSKTNEFILFALIGLVGLGLLTLFMWILTSLLGISYILSKIFATVVVYIWNFIARRKLYYN